jgi:hypothetical protein
MYRHAADPLATACAGPTRRNTLDHGWIFEKGTASGNVGGSDERYL